MDRKTFDVVAVITALLLIPLVAASTWAYVSGELPFTEFAGMWKEPVALLLGFWLRGLSAPKTS